MTTASRVAGVTFEVLGWPPDGPQLRLDHERFAYAGKFVMTSTGKAVWRDDEEVVAAVAFNEDRTDPGRLWLRYVTVRTDHRGEGIGPRLASRTVERAADRGYDRVAIAVNNPYAYEALYRAGFAFTGETTGIAELVLERGEAGRRRTGGPDRGRPDGADAERYRAGLDRFAERDLDDELRSFVAEKRERGPPDRMV